MCAERLAEVTWRGTLAQGAGLVTATTSGTFQDVPVSWPSRTAAANGQTSPEELLAAAHAASFAMALAAELERADTPAPGPWQLDVDATVTLAQTPAGWQVLASRLAARGVVPGLDGAQFRSLAAAARAACPLSRALSGNVAVSVEADLAG